MQKFDRNPIQIERLNAPGSRLSDIYYQLIRMQWLQLIVLAFSFFVVSNIAFGIFYYALRDGLRPNNLSLWETCFFSVHTFSTVGYGSIAPASLAVNLLAAFETFVGMVFMAMLTGLFFAKFAQPSSRFKFSENILYTKHYGRDALVFRVANFRSNRVMDAEVRLSALYDDVSHEGIRYRRIEDLPLERAHTPVFLFSFTCVHFIDDGKISARLMERLLQGENIDLLASIRGLDDTFGQTIHSAGLYKRHEVLRGGQFVDILSTKPDGSRTIDYANFDKVHFNSKS